MKNVLIQLIFVTLLLSSCSSGRRTVTIDSVRPADISVHPEIKNLLIVNRTKYSKEALNILEGILTGELPQEDKAAMQSFVKGFEDQLRFSERFDTRVANEILEGNSLTQAFPDPLNWSAVKTFCSNYRSDAILSIEIFDLDFIITDGSRKKTIKEEGSEEREINEFYATGVANMTIGVRLYDPINEKIVDQELFRKTNEWEATANTKSAALAALITRTDATRQLTESIGSAYAYKIAPMPIRISRSFVGKSKKAPALEQGARYADVGNWSQAAQVWENGLTTAPTKEAGHLAYNIAIAHELLGKLDQARNWAEKAYTQYGNDAAKKYINQLNQRIIDESIANGQMGN